MLNKSPRILLVSATKMEMPDIENLLVDCLISGVGMVASSHALTKQLITGKYDVVVGLGIAGSFNNRFEIGSVVQVVSDHLVELGVEDNGRFVPADEMNLVASDEMRFTTELRLNQLSEAIGITVNRVHGSTDSIQNVIEQFNPDIESMEGAAIAYVCKQFGVPWVQIRAISNKVEPRNKDAWNIPFAIKNLHLEVKRYIDTLVDEA